MSIYDEIRTERCYQDAKWGRETDDTKNTPFHWVTWIVSYATKWTFGGWRFNTRQVDDFRAKMIKTAAIAVAAVESLDRQRATRAAFKAFYETEDTP